MPLVDDEEGCIEWCNRVCSVTRNPDLRERQRQMVVEYQAVICPNQQ